MQVARHLLETCTKCGETKSLDEFYAVKGGVGGVRGDCKACFKARAAARYREDPEPNKARVKKWQQENAERLNEYRRTYRQRPEVKERDRGAYLKRKYGITLADYDRLLEQQGGGCAICGKPPRDDISLHVDHHHTSGQIRGLLCFTCNNALGDVEDDPDRALQLANYLMAPEVAAARELVLERVRRLVAASR